MPLSGTASKGSDTAPRRTHRVRRLFVGAVAGLAALALVGAAYQAIATEADNRKYPPPGELVDVGGYRLHLYCTGQGAPTVILDALFPGTVSNWVWVQPELAKTSRVCAYDRAGLGWSDRGPTPRDARQHAAELHALLAAAGLSGPIVLVGHSLGGLSVRMFAEEYPDEVAGVALIEATNPDAWKRLGKPEGVGVEHNMLVAAPVLGRLGVFRLGLVPSYSPDPDLPEQQQAELQAFFNSVKSLETIRDVDADFSAALQQVRTAGGFGAKPLVIVLGSQGDGSIAALQDLFADQAKLSTNSRTVMVEGATHAGLVDNRQAAVHTTAAILDVLQAVRTGPRRPAAP